MSAIWHALIANGLYRDLLAASVGVVVTHLFAWRPLRAHKKRQEKIIGLLRTDTPGGLSDIVDAVKHGTGEAAR